MNPRDIEFLFEIGTLKNIDRGWNQHLGFKCATDPEHSFRVAFIALILARKEGGANEEKILKMALAHDIPETRTGDLSYMQKVYVKADEDKAARDMLEGTSLFDFYSDIISEYEKRETLESKLVKDADNLDVDIEMKEFEERGSLLPEKWKETRRLVRDQKLHTNAAKELWDELQKSDPATWHLTTNKWYKMPETGR